MTYAFKSINYFGFIFVYSLIRAHFKFTTYHPLLRRGLGEAKEMRKFEMRPLILKLINFVLNF
jgi:hypothetical protein